MSDVAVRALLSQASGDKDGDGAAGQHGYSLRARHPLDPFNIRVLADRGFGETKLFRILLTNACAYSCAYCPMRAGRDLPRHALAPADLARVFMTAYQRGWVTGLFVTSGIPRNARFAMDRLIELVETLRFTHRYAGYLHAKAVSGAEPEQVERLALLCERVSYNLEAACQATLERAAPEKNFEQGLALLRRVREVSEEAGVRRLPGDPRPPGRPVSAGATTQFVVGIGGESDREFLAAAHRLWREKSIHHPHFAAFRPIEDTPFENEPEAPFLRENRLYQADYLLRQYGFEPEEIVLNEKGNLPLSRDPKLTWALSQPGRFPVEIATADRETLLRVPGLGPKTVERLLALRRTAANIDLSSLKALGAAARRAAGFLSYKGKRLGGLALQENLFGPEDLSSSPRAYGFSPGTFR